MISIENKIGVLFANLSRNEENVQPVKYSPKGEDISSRRETQYEGLALLEDSTFRGGTSIRYWM